MNNENKSFEEIQEKTNGIIKNTDEKLNDFELKEGMQFKTKGYDDIKKVLKTSNYGYKKYFINETFFSTDEQIDWEATKKINEVKEQHKQEKYIIWNPKGCNPKKIHENIKSAEQEAEKLALSQPNEDFYVLEVVKKVRGSVSIVWE